MPSYRIIPEILVSQIKPLSFEKERDLQQLFERALEALLGVCFIAIEFTTSDCQRGRIDTLGIDQDVFPAIIEYKKTRKENIINQGSFYLEWHVDHKCDFTLAAQEALGGDVQIYWSNPRLILIAESFSDYDKYAVNRIGANIELWTYRRYGDYLLLDIIIVANHQVKKSTTKIEEPEVGEDIETSTYTVDDHLQGKSSKKGDYLIS